MRHDAYAGFTVHVDWDDGRETYRTYTNSGVANAAADAAWDMKKPRARRVEVRDNRTSLIKGRSRLVNVPSPERTDDFNREYDIAPWAFDGDGYE